MILLTFTVYHDNTDFLKFKLLALSMKHNKELKLFLTVSEHEIEAGLLNAQDPHKKCIWFHRHINFASQEMEQNEYVARYLDKLTASADHESSPQELLQKLKDQMLTVLPSDNVVDYSVEWTPKGKYRSVYPKEIHSS